MDNKNKEILEIHHRRYACKSYDGNRKVSDEDFATIIESGRLSPSSYGLEPWKFLLLKNGEMKEDFKEFAWGAINSINGASHIVILLAKKGVTGTDSHTLYINEIKGYDEDMIKMRADRFKVFQKDDLKLLESDRALFDWASKQTYIAMANMMTTAAFLGIDSCPIEGFNREKLDNYLSDKGILDLNEWGVSVMVSFGYRNEDITPKTRRPVEEMFEVID